MWLFMLASDGEFCSPKTAGLAFSAGKFVFLIRIRIYFQKTSSAIIVRLFSHVEHNNEVILMINHFLCNIEPTTLVIKTLLHPYKKNRESVPTLKIEPICTVIKERK